MFSKKIFWVGSALLLIGVQADFHQMDANAQAAECCQEKMVGGVSYSLLPEAFDRSLPHQCLTSCVYTKTGMSSPKFCFARGDLATECRDPPPPTEATGCNIEVNIDYFGNDVAPPVRSTGMQDCANICSDTLGCLFWTYRKSDGTCHTKYSKAGRKSEDNAISGNLACANTPGTQVMSTYADQYRGCCSWKNITGSTGKNGFYIISAPHENVTDPCSDGCTYTEIQDQNQYCLPASSADDSECNSCNQCAETDLIGSSGCGQFAGKILGFLATCTVRCITSFDVGCIVGCITDGLVDSGLPGAAIDCVCQVIPGNLC